MRRSAGNRILLLYHRPILTPDAPTVREHISSFAEFSRFPTIAINTAYDFPKWLLKQEFPAIVLHYSLFGSGHYPMDRAFTDYLDRSKASLRIAFFQDEYYFCPQRFAFIKDHGIDCVFTLLETQYHDEVYGAHAGVESIHSTLTGYVGSRLIKMAKRYGRPSELRTIDVGYRGRELLPFMGRAAREKTYIAEEFKRRVSGLDLRCDIETKEYERLYGKKWYRFLGNCKGTLGVEAGVSVFDLEGEVYSAYQALARDHPGSTFEEMVERLAPVMNPWEDRIFYRTISPRHFEAAAFGICQILYEGHYSGILEPMRHYIPLKKDFSNLDEVVRLFRSPSVRREIRNESYRDLIASDTYSYSRFIQQFDIVLRGLGMTLPTIHKVSNVGAKLLSLRPDVIPRVSRFLMFAALKRGFLWTQRSPFAQRFVLPLAGSTIDRLEQWYKARRQRRRDSQQL